MHFALRFSVNLDLRVCHRRRPHLHPAPFTSKLSAGIQAATGLTVSLQNPCLHQFIPFIRTYAF
jgi:hypothetical protein